MVGFRSLSESKVRPTAENLARKPSLTSLFRGITLASAAVMLRIPRSLPHVLRQPPTVVVGRTAAACIHPIAAWRILPRSWRVMVLGVYAVTSFVTVLSALVVLNL
jgi:hypothetical protein